MMRVPYGSDFIRLARTVTNVGLDASTYMAIVTSPKG